MNSTEMREHIKALLFGLGRPLSYTELADMLEVGEEEIKSALAIREADAGIALVDDGRAVELRASSHAAPILEKARREEFSREVGRAGLEVLSAVLYRGPLSRSEIDFIRGVNSSQTVRTLTMRGLIRKVPNPRDERSFLYEPTTELLSELGIERKEELPDHDTVRKSLQELEKQYRGQESQA